MNNLKDEVIHDLVMLYLQREYSRPMLSGFEKDSTPEALVTRYNEVFQAMKAVKC